MYLITNRRVFPRKNGFDMFADTPSTRGPNELRIARLARRREDWTVSLLGDTLTRDEKKAIGAPVSRSSPASQYVARRILERVREHKRNLLLFVHGFNNSVKDVADRADTLATTYNLEVVPFSWPANGGGWRGAMDYHDDKDDARVSSGALNQLFKKARRLLRES